jgi:hypothetical protein
MRSIYRGIRELNVFFKELNMSTINEILIVLIIIGIVIISTIVILYCYHLIWSNPKKKKSKLTIMSMYWNYRIIKRKINRTSNSAETETEYAIHEVYYENDKAVYVSENPIYPCGETLKELKEDIKIYNLALTKPILFYEDFSTKSLY